MSSARRDDPELWERVKRKWLRGAKGGVAGKWNARKAMLAVREYKERGGGYIGPRDPDNSLKKWQDEEWGYIDGDPRGRYLPKKVRDSLTPAERRREKSRKKGREGEWVPYSASVNAKMRRAGIYGAAKRPAAKRPAAKRPAAKRPAAKRPAAKRPAAKRPAAKRPAAKRPAAKRPAAKRPAAKRPAVKRPAAKRPARRTG